MAVQLDTSATAFATGGPAASPSLTVAANANRILVAVFAYNNTGANCVTSVSYAIGSGGAWTRLGGAATATGINMSIEVWYSIAPASGSTTITPTVSGITSDFFATVFSFYNADQSTGMNGFVSSDSSASVTVATTAGDYAVAGIISALSASPIVTGTSAGSNGYDRFENSGSNAAAGSTTTVAWTSATAYQITCGANVLQSAGGGGGLPIFMQSDLLNGGLSELAGGFQ